jgi:hypothetical protein
MYPQKPEVSMVKWLNCESNYDFAVLVYRSWYTIAAYADENYAATATCDGAYIIQCFTFIVTSRMTLSYPLIRHMSKVRDCSNNNSLASSCTYHIHRIFVTQSWVIPNYYTQWTITEENIYYEVVTDRDVVLLLRRRIGSHAIVQSIACTVWPLSTTMPTFVRWLVWSRIDEIVSKS